MGEKLMQDKIDELVREHNRLSRWVHCLSGMVFILYFGIGFVLLALLMFWTKVLGN